MIKRIVLMELKPGNEAIFLDIFDQVKSEIRTQKGCMGIELLRSNMNEKISLWTISSWQSEEDLETYRSSSLFQKTWASVKSLFSDKARAWTLTSIETLT